MAGADYRALIEEGTEALQRSDTRAASRAFEAAAAAGGAPPWMALAEACNRQGDAAGTEAALRAQLAKDKRHLRALFAMADLKLRGGDERGASGWYRAALNQAAVDGVAPDLVASAQRAQQFLSGAGDRFGAHLESALASAGVAMDGRVGEAVDLLLGRTQLYLQQPSMLYFPGLPQRAFYERSEFGWLRSVEAAVPDMQNELHAVLAQTPRFEPYVQAQPGLPAPNNPLLNRSDWGAWYFWREGKIETDHARSAPATMAALAQAPMPMVGGRSPIALWSRLEPGTHITPHYGLLNTRLICHVALLVPPGCGLRVGSQTRTWVEGSTLIFDDSFEHEAWNRGASTRVVLLFEIWRPEIAQDERAALTLLFEAIDSYRSPEPT